MKKPLLDLREINAWLDADVNGRKYWSLYWEKESKTLWERANSLRQVQPPGGRED